MQNSRKFSIDQALEAYDKAIAIKPDISEDNSLYRQKVIGNSFLYSKKAGWLSVSESGQCLAALDSMNKAISINPIGSFYRQRALILLALQDLDKAEADYNRYRELDPISHSDDVFKSIFLNRNNLTQWLLTSQIQKQQFTQIITEVYKQQLYNLQKQQLSESQRQRLLFLINNIDTIYSDKNKNCLL